MSDRLVPVSPAVRLAIGQWPDDAARGAVAAFCAEHAISRSVFYAIRARARTEGAWAVVEPRSRRPVASPSRIDASVVGQALAVRAALEDAGLDCGPISVMDKMRALGMTAPSRASLARIFAGAGVVEREPRKRPRASYRRFVYPAPNCLWQMDATEWVLSGGRTCVVFQIVDDHSRLAIASLAATGETAEAAVQVVQTGIARHGVPQKFLTDNGAALNPSRRGMRGQLVDYLKRIGVQPITGKPGKPTTQGKNERFHQTLFRYLQKQPLAGSLEVLQTQIDTFDEIYNTARPHQGLPGRVTPRQAWDATPKAEPPRPPVDELPAPPANLTGQATRVVRRNGTIGVLGIQFRLGAAWASHTVHVIWDPTTVEVFDDKGESIQAWTHPAPGTRHVGNGKPRGFMAY